MGHVSKTFRVPHERQTTLFERALWAFRPVPVELLRAVDDVSLEIERGAFVGIIGANGSGKSTLLKLIAGVLEPDAGEIRVRGTLVPLLELGVGFQQELTLRENVALYGAVIGYPPEEIPERTNEVLAFAELERFRDAKLKSLSSGMRMRLAFATAVHARADIMLLDEVLAVGDAPFQRKCLEAFAQLRREGRTIVLVTHDLATARNFCDRLVWIDKGRIVESGDAGRVVELYLAVYERAGLPMQSPLLTDAPSDHRFGDGTMRFAHAQLEDASGRPVTIAVTGQRVTLRFDCVAVGSSDPTFGIIVHRGDQVIYRTTSLDLGVPTRTVVAGDRCRVAMPLTLALANGHYTVSLAVAHARNGMIHDWVNHALAFVVERSPSGEGTADLGAAFEYSVERVADPPVEGAATGS